MAKEDRRYEKIKTGEQPRKNNNGDGKCSVCRQKRRRDVHIAAKSMCTRTAYRSNGRSTELFEKETLGIKAFGHREVDRKERDVVEFTLSSLRGGKVKKPDEKIGKETGILEKYNGIIMEQLQMGIIEMVPELDMAEKVHYLPHTAVIRDEAETTKVSRRSEQVGRGCFKLRKWKTNDSDLKNRINEGEKHDNSGIVSPLCVKAKIIFQELCKQNLGWDDPVPEEQQRRWEAWVSELNEVKSITIPRFMFYEGEGEVLDCQLHGFGDASQKGYCAAIYLVYKTNSGIFTKLLCSKSRVAPLKQLTIPRLELLSARILATLMSNVKNALSEQVTINKVRFWLDSKTALYWINNQGEWKQWVQFRVAEILQQSEKDQWGHVAGLSNPADLGSRGTTASQLVHSELWWRGPAWLREGEESWPAELRLEDTADIAVERKKTVVANMIAEEEEGLSQVIDASRFNNLNTLLRVTALTYRFIDNLKAKKAKQEIKVNNLEVNDMKRAELYWIREAQKQLTREEHYKKTKESLGIEEREGTLKCKGRLEHSDLDIEARFPIILPKNHKFTDLIVVNSHLKTHHGGVKTTLAEVRTKFWIVKGRQYVKKLLRGCFICKKFEGKAYRPGQTSALPEFRVTQALPFSRVGVDFAGPFFVKQTSSEMSKAYLALFSCCVTRALHLELVSDLNASTFINCLRRFCARRGTPHLIVSDNAKTFKATANSLKEVSKESRVQEFLLSRRIQWKFNLERSPWWGGFFERMVQSVKRCARKVLGNAKLTFDELNTVLSEIENTLNSRPLTYSYDEIEGQVLTPSHLMFGHRLSTLSEGIEIGESDDEEDYAGNSNTVNSRFLYLTRKLTHFWNRWRKEYLVDLRERHRQKKNQPSSVSVGDIVLIYEDNTKRGLWKTGIVEALIKGTDGVVRGAKVRKPGKGKPDVLNRPIQKLYPLEVESSQRNSNENSGSVSSDRNQNELQGHQDQSRRPTRAAARDARAKTQALLDSL
eukprot:gene15458-biopygen12863